MNIILGASGQVGSHIVKELIKTSSPVRAIVRNTSSVFDNKVEVRTADFFNQTQLTNALEGGATVFLLTPEKPSSKDILRETKQLIDNYKQAIRANGIKRIVGLSSIGAQVKEKTGNILLSRMLEHGFDDLKIDKVFIRPSYYFSNWLGFFETVEQFSVLPTFFPKDLKIDMVSPIDVARFVAEKINNENKSNNKKIFELAGPEKYSSVDVAAIFSKLLHKNVEVQPIPKENWNETLTSAGFTENTSANLMEMTEAVIDNVLVPENPEYIVKLPTTLEQYLREQLKK